MTEPTYTFVSVSTAKPGRLDDLGDADGAVERRAMFDQVVAANLHPEREPTADHVSYRFVDLEQDSRSPADRDPRPVCPGCGSRPAVTALRAVQNVLTAHARVMTIPQDLGRSDENLALRQLRVDALDFVEFRFGESGFETLFTCQFSPCE